MCSFPRSTGALPATRSRFPSPTASQTTYRNIDLVECASTSSELHDFVLIIFHYSFSHHHQLIIISDKSHFIYEGTPKVLRTRWSKSLFEKYNGTFLVYAS